MPIMRKGRFVQIACSVDNVEHEEGRENLYALDENGVVWWYDWNAVKWGTMATARKSAEEEGETE